MLDVEGAVHYTIYISIIIVMMCCETKKCAAQQTKNISSLWKFYKSTLFFFLCWPEVTRNLFFRNKPEKVVHAKISCVFIFICPDHPSRLFAMIHVLLRPLDSLVIDRRSVYMLHQY